MSASAFLASYEYTLRTPEFCRDREYTGVIRPGAHVHLVGLNAKLALNGTKAVIQSFDHDAHRWTVLVHSSSSVQVRPENIRVDGFQPQDVIDAKAWLKEASFGNLPILPPIPFEHSSKPSADEAELVSAVLRSTSGAAVRHGGGDDASVCEPSYLWDGEKLSYELPGGMRPELLAPVLAAS